MSKRLLPTGHEERADVNKVEEIDEKETHYSMWKETGYCKYVNGSWHISGLHPHQDVRIYIFYIYKVKKLHDKK